MAHFTHDDRIAAWWRANSDAFTPLASTAPVLTPDALADWLAQWRRRPDDD